MELPALVAIQHPVVHHIVEVAAAAVALATPCIPHSEGYAPRVVVVLHTVAAESGVGYHTAGFDDSPGADHPCLAFLLLGLASD